MGSKATNDPTHILKLYRNQLTHFVSVASFSFDLILFSCVASVFVLASYSTGGMRKYISVKRNSFVICYGQFTRTNICSYRKHSTVL